MKGASKQCAAKECEWGEGLSVDKCFGCDNYAHHMCNNAFFDGGELSERYCSSECVLKRNDGCAQRSGVTDDQETAATIATAAALLCVSGAALVRSLKLHNAISP